MFVLAQVTSQTSLWQLRQTDILCSELAFRVPQQTQLGRMENSGWDEHTLEGQHPNSVVMDQSP
jgi:hypothetical protein